MDTQIDLAKLIDIKRQLNEIIKETKHKCRFSIIVRKALA
jgi:hypothetical protein